VLVEKRPFVGGRVTQLYKYFPKLCSAPYHGASPAVYS
jgi:heterodisulfide reductase subunit A-like polyferredoxin